MDKRWIGILIILIIGLGLMYLIADDSPRVGNAITVIKDVNVAVPLGFGISNSQADSCQFYNKQTNQTVDIACLNKADRISEYNNKLKSLEEDENIIINNNFTNETLSLIDFTNTSKDTIHVEIVYFKKLDYTFSLKTTDLPNSNNVKRENVTQYIMDTLEYDFKQD